MDVVDLAARFFAHDCSETQGNRMAEVLRAAAALAGLIDMTCPDGREKSLAITKLEEVVFWANAGIARHPD